MTAPGYLVIVSTRQSRVHADLDRSGPRLPLSGAGVSRNFLLLTPWLINVNCDISCELIIECLCWYHPDYQDITVICIVYPGQYLGNDVLGTFVVSSEPLFEGRKLFVDIHVELFPAKAFRLAYIY